MSQTRSLPIKKSSLEREETSGYQHIEDRLTPELVFVFVEPIGGGADDAIDTLERLLKRPKFKYDIHKISISDIIHNESLKQNINIQKLHYLLERIPELSDRAKRINILQQQGNLLRKNNSRDFLAKMAMQKISKYRMSNNGIVKMDEKTHRPEPLRVAHIIKSVKNEKELELLKAVYGNMLILIAVIGSLQQHKKKYA